MLNARRKRYIEALNRLQDDGFVNVVSLILSVPIERKGMGLLNRTITGGGANGFRTKQRPKHNGIDFNAGPHAQGYAPEVNFLAHNARCTRSELHGSYGNVVDITHTIPCRVKGIGKTSQVTFRFAHLHNRNVKKGDTVPLWAKLGTLGQTGNAAGAHLHFEVWVDGKRINPHDLSYLVPTVENLTIHVVRSGDTYGKISNMYGVPVVSLRKWNGWPDAKIPVGAHMWLVKPPEYPVPEPDLPDRPDEPPHPIEPEPEDTAAQIEALESHVAALSAKLQAIKKILEE